VGKATKTGTYTVKFTAKNAAGTKTKTVKIVVKNPGFAVDVNVRANGATDAISVNSGGTVPMYVGVVQNISVASTPGKSGVAKSAASYVSATGLPPGLKYSAGVISGVPTKTGTYTVKLVFKNALGWSKSFTMKMSVKSLPAFARGTFNGWSHAVDGDTGEPTDIVRKATVSVTSAGKISASVGSLKFARTGWTVDGLGNYVATMRAVRTSGSGKSAKTYTDVLSLTLDPGAAWTEDQLTGMMGTFNGNVTQAKALASLEGGDPTLSPSNVDTYISARRNPFGDNAEAQALAAEFAASGTWKWTDGEGLVWNVKVASNGVATISRTTGTGSSKKTISATAVITWDGGDSIPYAVFKVDGRILEVPL
jgi:PKD repeat protein